MGMADLVPGVSGGTIALITGIYEELIQSIAEFNVENLKLLLNNNPKQFWVNINGKFLVIVFSGILSSIIFLSFFIKWLIENQPIAIWSFFFGLLTASIFILKKEDPHMAPRSISKKISLAFACFIAILDCMYVLYA